ncbi:MAG: Hsp70 family protein [Deltaproteobacteria bacterium]|nr:Hsp70 family protein [Deltaproteobacteria bacterium]
MRRKGGAQPEFLTLGSASILYGDTYLIPTVCIPETNSIGAEAIKKSPLMDIKKMLLEDHPEGKRYMETYIRILFKRLKEALSQGKGFSFFSKKLIDAIYVTAPVGFQNYRKALQKILEKTIRGARIEFVEEPLAAAIGYQVAEERDKVVLIVDFGGCTLNTMLARLNINEAHVIAKPDTAQTLGGHDIDLWLAEYLAKKIGMSKDDKLRGVLASTAEEIKISLSEHRLTSFAWNGTEICKVSREDLEDLLAKHDFYKTIDRTISYILKKAEKVGVKKDMIEAVLLTGGSSQIPSFKEKIEHLFPELAKGNAVYEHSPLSAAAHGAALYPTKNLIVDRHTSLACAIRYATRDKDAPYSYKIILENNESLPLEKTFRIAPARTLGAQNEIYLELFEVPENLVARRWVMESGMEFIRQEMKQPRDMALKACKIITLPFQEPLGEDIDITFCVKDTGHLAVRCGKENREIETGIRLQ